MNCHIWFCCLQAEKMNFNFLLFRSLQIVLFCMVFSLNKCSKILAQGVNKTYSKIDGKVYVTSTKDKDWISHTRVSLESGKYRAFLRNDGTFTVNGLPPGSLLVEVTNPNYLFEPIRVDITSTGKMRARRNNIVQPSKVQTMPYPLEFRERGKASYFQQREQWRITDFLFNPMVLTMVLPFLLIVLLPRLMNNADPETQKEMQQQMSVLNQKPALPDMSEMITNYLSGGQKPIKAKKTTKK